MTSPPYFSFQLKTLQTSDQRESQTLEKVVTIEYKILIV